VKKHLNQSKPHPPLPNSLSPAFTFKTERPTDYSLKKLSTPRVNEIWTQSDIAKGLPIGYHYFLTLKFAGPEIDSCTPSSTPTLPHIHTWALLHKTIVNFTVTMTLRGMILGFTIRIGHLHKGDLIVHLLGWCLVKLDYC
jgi:hypothetical protein